MRSSPGLLRALVLLLLLGCDPKPTATADLTASLEQLSDSVPLRRFDATVALLRSETPNLPSALSDALRDDLLRRAFEESRDARAALDFVLLKLSGRRVFPGSKPQPGRPHVLLVSIDTLRADHLGCYGYRRDTTPVIDDLAEQGALFLNAFSPSSWTLPSHMSIFTSLYPSFHKLEKGGVSGACASTSRLPPWPAGCAPPATGQPGS